MVLGKSLLVVLVVPYHNPDPSCDYKMLVATSVLHFGGWRESARYMTMAQVGFISIFSALLSILECSIRIVTAI